MADPINSSDRRTSSGNLVGYGTITRAIKVHTISAEMILREKTCFAIILERSNSAAVVCKMWCRENTNTMSAPKQTSLMLKAGISLIARRFPTRTLTSGSDLPITRLHEAKRKELDDILEPLAEKKNVAVSIDETMEIGGVPLEHQEERTARILRPAREATQTPWNNTKAWRIELDNRHRWENPLIGWTSSGDPLSNTSMMLKFASQEDAIAFCEKNRWNYELEEVHERQIKPKNYGINFSWNKKSRISTK